MNDSIFIQRLQTTCIVGIFKRERVRKQKVCIDLEIPCRCDKAARFDRIEDTVNYKRIAKRTLSFVEKSRFYLIETLAERLANLLIKEFHLPFVTLKLSKPGAIRYSENVGVRITRHAKTLEKVYLSLGSNIKKHLMLNSAVKELDRHLEVKRASSVYESDAVGPVKQDRFWNAVVEIETSLEPQKLKSLLKGIETRLGRKPKLQKFAPRLIDIDIVFYGRRNIKKNGLEIPHPDAAHEPYMLAPLAEIAPHLIHPMLGKTVLELLATDVTKKCHIAV